MFAKLSDDEKLATETAVREFTQPFIELRAVLESHKDDPEFRQQLIEALTQKATEKKADESKSGST